MHLFALDMLAYLSRAFGWLRVCIDFPCAYPNANGHLILSSLWVSRGVSLGKGKMSIAPYGFHSRPNSLRPIGPGPKAPNLRCLWEDHPDGAREEWGMGWEGGSRLITAGVSMAQAMLIMGVRDE